MSRLIAQFHNQRLRGVTLDRWGRVRDFQELASPDAVRGGVVVDPDRAATTLRQLVQRAALAAGPVTGIIWLLPPAAALENVETLPAAVRRSDLNAATTLMFERLLGPDPQPTRRYWSAYRPRGVGSAVWHLHLCAPLRAAVDGHINLARSVNLKPVSIRPHSCAVVAQARQRHRLSAGVALWADLAGGITMAGFRGGAIVALAAARFASDQTDDVLGQVDQLLRPALAAELPQTVALLGLADNDALAEHLAATGWRPLRAGRPLDAAAQTRDLLAACNGPRYGVGELLPPELRPLGLRSTPVAVTALALLLTVELTLGYGYRQARQADLAAVQAALQAAASRAERIADIQAAARRQLETELAQYETAVSQLPAGIDPVLAVYGAVMQAAREHRVTVQNLAPYTGVWTDQQGETVLRLTAVGPNLNAVTRFARRLRQPPFSRAALQQLTLQPGGERATPDGAPVRLPDQFEFSLLVGYRFEGKETAP